MCCVEFRCGAGWAKQFWDKAALLWDGVDEKTDETNHAWAGMDFVCVTRPQHINDSRQKSMPVDVFEFLRATAQCFAKARLRQFEKSSHSRSLITLASVRAPGS